MECDGGGEKGSQTNPTHLAPKLAHFLEASLCRGLDWPFFFIELFIRMVEPAGRYEDQRMIKIEGDK